MDEFYNSMGRPEEASGYNYTPPEDREVPSDFAEFAGVAHKHGLTQEQFRGVLGDLLEGQWAASDQYNLDMEEDRKELMKEWGAAHDQNMTKVKNFLHLMDAPEAIVDMFANETMDSEEIKWLYQIATSTKSEPELAKQQTTQTDLVSPSEAMEKISEMMNNPEHPYWNSSDPGHQAAIQKMLKLQAMAHPE